MREFLITGAIMAVIGAVVFGAALLTMILIQMPTW